MTILKHFIKTKKHPYTHSFFNKHISFQHITTPTPLHDKDCLYFFLRMQFALIYRVLPI